MSGSTAGGEARTLAVVREAGLVTIGAAPPPAWRLAVWRGPGATLWWDAADPDECGAVVTDTASAAGWLGRAWGAPAAALTGDGADAGAPDAVEVAPGAFADAARRVALARWRRAWWPASRIALIPPLDPRVTAAELALALADLAAAEAGAEAGPDTGRELDRALADLATAERRLGSLDPAHPVAGHVRALAAERGVAPAETPPSAHPPLRRAPDPVRAPLSGTVPVDAAATPHGVIDAADEARWRVVFRGASASIVLEVLAAPTFAGAPTPEVYASFAGVTARLALHDGTWAAEHPVPLAALTTPPADRVVQVYAPGHEPRPAAPAEERIRLARERLLSPQSPAEADAAARPIE